MSRYQPFLSMIHISDWLPTLYTFGGGLARNLPKDLDGINQKSFLQNAKNDSKSNRKEMFYHYKPRGGNAFRLVESKLKFRTR